LRAAHRRSPIPSNRSSPKFDPMGRSELVITWEHSAGAPEPCYRAYDTAKPFSLLLEEIGPLMNDDGISIIHEENVIGEPGKNRILLNGMVLEDLLAGVGAAQDYCRASRSAMTEPPATRRLRSFSGKRSFLHSKNRRP
jgi:hypothetical protein